MGADIVQVNAHGSVSGTDTPGDSEEELEPPIPRLQPQSGPKVTWIETEKPIKPAQSGLDVKIFSKETNDSASTFSEVTTINQPPLEDAHQVPTGELVAFLGTNLEYGLSETDAELRLKRDGPNKVNEPKATSPVEIIVRQISNSLTIVLMITMGISFGISDYIEGSVIAAVILLNVVIGFVQDYRAEQQILSLQALSAPESKVLRAGLVQTIKAEKLVVGDIVKLNVGDVVPADLRLVEGINVSMDEAILTGESLPSQKDPLCIITRHDAALGDRINMCYAGTTMTMGRATAVVVSTGMSTEIGKIADLLRQKKTGPQHSNPIVRWLSSVKSHTKSILGLVGTPLQVKLSKFALLLFALAILLAVIVYSVNLWQIDGEVLIYGICVAVAVIPESLIAVLTITVAVGTQAMAKGNVVVRRLASLEAVGGVNAICSDKTGTLTQGKMIVRKALVPDMEALTVHNTSNPFDPTSGHVNLGSEAANAQALVFSKPGNKFLSAIALCNVSSVYNSRGIKSAAETIDTVTTVDTVPQNNWVAVGEPTEIALQVFAMRFDFGKTAILSDGKRELLAEYPFDSTIKRMTVVYEDSQTRMIESYTKGAFEVIIPLLSLLESDKQNLLEEAGKMANEGLRVLCVAHKTCQSSDRSWLSTRAEAECDLEFGGLVGLYDPPRQETAGAVRKSQRAGIDVHMLTGDHVGTARAVAHEVGILKPNAAEGEVMNAEAFDKLSDADIDQMERLPLVLARCSPSTKVRMLDALQRREKFCVMTGDGVNDSPSLKKADVGIAMGIAGADVAKDASDMILTDDNFASIVKAVEEGRRLFDNIQKFLLHLLISNIAQVVLLLTGLAFKDGQGYSIFPLSALGILWVNLITSSFLAIGLGLEEGIADIMDREPHDQKKGVFTWELIGDKMIYGVFMGVLCLVAFIAVAYGAGNGDLGRNCNEGWNDTCGITFRARATTWATLTMLLLVTALEVKHFSRSLFALAPERYGSKGLRSVYGPIWANRFLFWAVIAGFVVAFPVIYLPTVNKLVFKQSAITWEWGIVFGLLVVYIALVESWKAIKRRFDIGTRPSRATDIPEI